MILGLIVARGGSKRLPGKNLRELGGRTLVGWAIDAARRSAWLDEVALTSDDDAILRVAFEEAVRPIRRPLDLARDDSRIYGAILHALTVVSADHVVLLQPTSPLRTADDIDGCVALAMDSGKPSQSWCDGIANGAVYVGSSEWLRAGGNWDHDPAVLKYMMPAERSIDINTIEDFEAAEGLVG